MKELPRTTPNELITSSQVEMMTNTGTSENTLNKHNENLKIIIPNNG